MSADSGATPGERDLIAVEQRLSVLWADLSPAQQMVLDTIVGAGLTMTTAGDTTGFSAMTGNQELLRTYIQSRTAELQGESQQADTGDDDAPAGRRWDLRPMLDWFHHRPAAQPHAHAQRGTTV